ncbi:hypothetical protein RINTHM_11680 [Richelia intracellularis HM01]|nr:hypothetical protein RINTHM_11680 [Richelia intracellularis HM01]
MISKGEKGWHSLTKVGGGVYNRPPLSLGEIINTPISF